MVTPLPGPSSAQASGPSHDLGPLAWVLDELRKTLEQANKGLRRYAREAATARALRASGMSDSDPTPDPAALSVSQRQLHQAAGALVLVGQAGPAKLLQAMETAVRGFVQSPDRCTPEAAQQVQQASFAVIDCLQRQLGDHPVSPVALFPAYQAVQALNGADRVHPADLFEPHGQPWRWRPAPLPAAAAAPSDPAAQRSALDQAVLGIVRGGDTQAAAQLRDLSLGLSQSAGDDDARAFWQLAAGLGEGLAHGLLPMDLFAKRAASRILLQYATLARGEPSVSERLAQDLLFFCAQAAVPDGADAPLLSALRDTYEVTACQPVDYTQPVLGLFDPGLLAQALKRIAAAKDAWAAAVGGDTDKLRKLTEPFRSMAESLLKLHPPSTALAQTLNQVVDHTVRQNRAPSAAMAMEVATAVLYLEASCQELDPSDPTLASRTARLAERLSHVLAGGTPEPLEPWMEALYRRVNERQTMGSVVSELRASLDEIERGLDQFFRQPQERQALAKVPGQLGQMRGVLSVLGVEPASQAVAHMRTTVEGLIAQPPEPSELTATFDHLGHNLGVLGLLIDMLHHQPTLARQLFGFDPATGTLSRKGPPSAPPPTQADAPPPVVSVDPSAPWADQALALAARPDAEPDTLAERLDNIATQAGLADQPALAAAARQAATVLAVPSEPDRVGTQTPVVAASALAALADLAAQATRSASPSEPLPAPPPSPYDEDDLLGIFLDEAREVLAAGQAAVGTLHTAPEDDAQLIALRRSFHTLKGSARMVGLARFGEAAWALEQLMNHWLADHQPASPALLAVCGESLHALADWVAAIADGRDADWRPEPFRARADALRLGAPDAAVGAEPLAEPPASATFADLSPDELDGLTLLDGSPGARVAPESPVDQEADAPADLSDAVSTVPLADVDFDAMFRGIDLDLPRPDQPAPDRPGVATNASAPSHGPDAAAPTDALDIDWDGLALVANTPDSAPPQDLDAAAFALDLPADLEQALDLPDLGDTAGPSEPPETPATALASAGLPPAADWLATLPSLDLPAPVTAAETPSDAPPAVVHGAEPQPLNMPENGHRADDDRHDEQTRVIDGLRVHIPLYNVYLNEADEWSRQLQTDLSELLLEPHQPVAEGTVALAHSLAGSSATVGFTALSHLARQLEHALDHARIRQHCSTDAAQVFLDAANDIRRLLHQFAAGFLKVPNPSMLDRLGALNATFPAKLSTGHAGVDEPRTGAPFLADLPAHGPATADFEEKSGPTHVEYRSYATESVALAAPDVDDELDEIDALDAELFPFFAEEAVELLPQLGSALRQWAARPDNMGARTEALRVLHTFKGSARLAGAMRLGELAHLFESDIEALGNGVADSTDVAPLLTRLDALANAFDALRQGGTRLRTAAKTPDLPMPSAAGSPMPSQPQVAQATPVDQGLPGNALAAGASAPVQRSQPTVRVRADLLERLLGQTGEVMLTRSRLEGELAQLRGSLKELTGNLDRLRGQLREVELQAESQMQSRLAQAKESPNSFDPLEFDRFTRVQELTRMMAESVNDVTVVQRGLQHTLQVSDDALTAQARQTRELQRDLLRTRMLEFEGLSERLYRVVRQASKETGKQVRLDIEGGRIEMDRAVLDRMAPTFEHLLRNSVVHGIEAPETRLARGKPELGVITVRLRQEGNDVSVEFEDDGAGLDLNAIRQRAEALGLIERGAWQSDANLANLIFLPGVSTASTVTELAGRGIGMDVVRSEVTALGGRIETLHRPGHGTLFKLVLPLTTAVTQVVMVRAGGLTVGVPASIVALVRRTTPAELAAAYASGQLDLGGEAVPFFWASALLQGPAADAPPPDPTSASGSHIPVLLLRSAGQGLALHVSEVLGNQEMVVKNLGAQLARLPGLSGITVLASGAVALIYNPVALAAVHGESAREAVRQHRLGDGQPRRPSAPLAPLVLVVDDSITVRRVTQRLLQREGYRVALAADGLQALEALEREQPALVLSDIEMPRMDGFDLLRNLRADARWARLPVVVITSRIAEKHRDHALALGAHHYLGKPYDEDTLMALVREHTGSALTH